MNQSHLPPRARTGGRRISGRAQNDHILDPYQQQQKLSEPTLCPQCGAVYHHGRWRWAAKPNESQVALCAACRRINDNLPAGIVTLHGPFERERIEEIVALARHQEKAEKGEHPLNRIIGIDATAERIVIQTTDIHLPRRIGNATRRALHGRLEENFDDSGYFVRVTWTAND